MIVELLATIGFEGTSTREAGACSRTVVGSTGVESVVARALLEGMNSAGCKAVAAVERSGPDSVAEESDM